MLNWEGKEGGSITALIAPSLRECLNALFYINDMLIIMKRYHVHKYTKYYINISFPFPRYKSTNIPINRKI